MLRNLGCSLLVLVPSLLGSAALAHDTWINRGSYKNPAGEWCCGAEDCGVVSRDAVKAGTGGYSLRCAARSPTASASPATRPTARRGTKA